MNLIVITVLIVTIEATLTGKVFENEKLGKKYFYDTNIKLNYSQAKQFCYRNDATLVQLKSRQETDWILNSVRPKDEFHLGVAAVSKWNQFSHWLDGTRLEFTDYFEHNFTNGFSCNSLHVHVYPIAEVGKWVSYDCNDQMHVICERNVVDAGLVVSSDRDFEVNKISQLQDTIKRQSNVTMKITLELQSHRRFTESLLKNLTTIKNVTDYMTNYAYNLGYTSKQQWIAINEIILKLESNRRFNQSLINTINNLTNYVHHLRDEHDQIDNNYKQMKSRKVKVPSTSLQTILCTISVIMSIVNVGLLYMIATGRKIAFVM